MLDLFFLAFLNTLRNTRRSSITVLSIAIGCTALISFASFIEFTFEGLRETTIRTQLGHMQIYAKGYWERRVAEPEVVLIHDVKALETELEAIRHVTTVTHRLSFSGIGGIDQSTVSMSVMGVDPTRDMGFSDFEIVLDGRNLMPGDEDVGVIGSELAKGIGAKIGDWVTVLTTSLNGVINAVDFEVVGIVRTGSIEYDSVFVKLPVGLVQRALDTEAVERVIIMLDDTESLARVRPRIEALLASFPGGYETRDWQELAVFYEAVVSLYSGLFRVFAAIIATVVMFSVANTMSMAVLERMGESGALRAIGATRGMIMTMFIFEGLCVGLIGGILGLGGAIAISLGIDWVGGIPMPPPPAMSQGYQAFLPLSASVLTLGVAISIMATFISSIYPSWVASKVNIVEALQK